MAQNSDTSSSPGSTESVPRGSNRDPKRAVGSRAQTTRRRKRRVLEFPRRFWFSLVALFILFIGIGAAYFWLVQLEKVPSWASFVMTSLWLIAGLGVFTLFFWVWRQFLLFSEDLSRWSERLRNGQLDARMPLPQSGCLSIRTREQINAITDDYEAASLVQRQRMDRQEKFIAEKKHHLKVLYDVATVINRSDSLEDLLQRFLVTLQGVVDAKAVAIRLLGSDGEMRLVAHLGLDEQVVKLENTIPDSRCACLRAANECRMQSYDNMHFCREAIGRPFFDNDDAVRMLAIPLQYRDKTLGIYNLYVSDTRADNLEEEYALLISIGQHLGMAIEKANVDQEAHTLSIVEERTRMAHELHDSLAQTIASLRFKARLLDDSLHRDDEAAVWQELEGLENTIDDAYAELRSLITDFRAPIDGKGVVRAIKNMAERFRRENDVDMFFYHNWSLAHLDSEAEVEVIRIVQEALNNIRKHSQANTVRILMYSSEEGRCSILVEDDGIGLPETPVEPDPVTGEHIGMHIMQERAAKLNGELQYESDPDEGGTLLQLSFDVVPAGS